MRNIKALNLKVGALLFVKRKSECLNHRGHPLFLASGFGHVPLKRKLCVLLRHLKPAAPHGLRLMHKLNAPARKFRQCLLQRPRVRCIRTDHGLRNLTSGVVLCNKGFENV